MKNQFFMTLKNTGSNVNIKKTIVTVTMLVFSTAIGAADQRFSREFNKISFQGIISTPIRLNINTVYTDHPKSLNTLAKNRYEENKQAHKLVPVDFANIYITKQELASMHAVSEVCNKLLQADLHNKFEKAFNIQLKYLFPKIKNPKAAMQYLSTQKDYKLLLNKWKNKYSEEENIALCEEMVNSID